jgi:AraC-like DNA-binding protein
MTRRPRTEGTQVTSRSAAAQHLRDLARLRRVRDRIDREYAQPLDVEALARGAHMSAGHLSRQFKLAYGESPYGYLMTRRIERAMALLRRGDLSVTEVCFAVGCSSLGTFSSRFTELVGMPPSTYRDQATRATVGLPPCVAKQVTRPIRNQEAPAQLRCWNQWSVPCSTRIWGRRAAAHLCDRHGPHHSRQLPPARRPERLPGLLSRRPQP